LYDDILLKPPSEKKVKEKKERKSKKKKKDEDDEDDLVTTVEKRNEAQEEPQAVSEKSQKMITLIENYRLSKYSSRKIRDRIGEIPSRKELNKLSEKKLKELLESYRACVNLIDQKFLGSMLFNTGINAIEKGTKMLLKSDSMDGLSMACLANERIQELVEIISLEKLNIMSIKPEHALLFELGKTISTVYACNKAKQIAEAQEAQEVDEAQEAGTQEAPKGTPSRKASSHGKQAPALLARSSPREQGSSFAGTKFAHGKQEPQDLEIEDDIVDLQRPELMRQVAESIRKRLKPNTPPALEVDQEEPEEHEPKASPPRSEEVVRNHEKRDEEDKELEKEKPSNFLSYALMFGGVISFCAGLFRLQ